MKDNFKPVLSYGNAQTMKKAIISDNRRKSGVYRWVNLNSGKDYIGSSVDLE